MSTKTRHLYMVVLSMLLWSTPLPLFPQDGRIGQNKENPEKIRKIFNWRIADWWEVTRGANMYDRGWKFRTYLFKVTDEKPVDIDGQTKNCFIVFMYEGTREQVKEEEELFERTALIDDPFVNKFLIRIIYISSFDYAPVKIENRPNTRGLADSKIASYVFKTERRISGLIYPKDKEYTNRGIVRKENDGEVIYYYLLQKGYPWVVKQEGFRTERGDGGECWILDSFAVLTRTSMHGELNVSVTLDHLLAKKDINKWYKEQKVPKDMIMIYALNRHIGRRIIGFEQFKEEFGFQKHKPEEECPVCHNLSNRSLKPCPL